MENIQAVGTPYAARYNSDQANWGRFIGYFMTIMGGYFMMIMGGYFMTIMDGYFMTIMGGYFMTIMGGYFMTIMGGYFMTIMGGYFMTIMGREKHERILFHTSCVLFLLSVYRCLTYGSCRIAG